MTRALLQQALDALEWCEPAGTVGYGGVARRSAAIAALREALAAPQAEPVALESVHLTRDTRGMCVVRVNGRVAIRDNGDIIDHMATLEWFAAPPAAPIWEQLREMGEAHAAAPAPVVPLTDKQINNIADALLDNGGCTMLTLARAIEKAHGIGGGNG